VNYRRISGNGKNHKLGKRNANSSKKEGKKKKREGKILKTSIFSP
jgi:hypothetical protein